MTANKKLISEAILAAIDDINETLPINRRIGKDPQTVLWGPHGGIDSLTLTLLIVALEQKIEQLFHTSITLIDQTDSSFESAFGNIKTLQTHIEQLLEK